MKWDFTSVKFNSTYTWHLTNNDYFYLSGNKHNLLKWNYFHLSELELRLNEIKFQISETGFYLSEIAFDILV